MDRVQTGGLWTGSKGVVHGPGVHVLYTSVQRSYRRIFADVLVDIFPHWHTSYLIEAVAVYIVVYIGRKS